MNDCDTKALAWLLEGEGSFMVNKGRNNSRKRWPVVVLKMTDEDIVRGAAKLAGVGRVYGPYCPAPPRKPFWSWQVWVKADSLALMRNVRPYMGQRRGAKIDEILAEFEEAA